MLFSHNFKFTEEIIMCVCGLHGEEGLMVQCGGEGDQMIPNGKGEPATDSDSAVKNQKGCGVWQHARCMAVTDVGEPYYCHRCQPREVIYNSFRAAHVINPILIPSYYYCRLIWKYHWTNSLKKETNSTYP